MSARVQEPREGSSTGSPQAEIADNCMLVTANLDLWESRTAPPNYRALSLLPHLMLLIFKSFILFFLIQKLQMLGSFICLPESQGSPTEVYLSSKDFGMSPNNPY